MVILLFQILDTVLRHLYSVAVLRKYALDVVRPLDLHKSYFREHWVKHCEKIGINATPHQLRHTYATMLYEWNISEKDAQTIMGHSDISITHNIYTHVRESHMTNTIENINERIAKESL